MTQQNPDDGATFTDESHARRYAARINGLHPRVRMAPRLDQDASEDDARRAAAGDIGIVARVATDGKVVIVRLPDGHVLSLVSPREVTEFIEAIWEQAALEAERDAAAPALLDALAHAQELAGARGNFSPDAVGQALADALRALPRWTNVMPSTY